MLLDGSDKCDQELTAWCIGKKGWSPCSRPAPTSLTPRWPLRWKKRNYRAIDQPIRRFFFALSRVSRATSAKAAVPRNFAGYAKLTGSPQEARGRNAGIVEGKYSPQSVAGSVQNSCAGGYMVVTWSPETTKPNLVCWAKCLILMGWLMGLEPTTTGITILTF
jgi:hypothetical protein